MHTALEACLEETFEEHVQELEAQKLKKIVVYCQSFSFSVRKVIPHMITVSKLEQGLWRGMAITMLVLNIVRLGSV